MVGSRPTLGMALFILVAAEMVPIVSGLPQTRFIPIGPVIVNVRRTEGQL